MGGSNREILSLEDIPKIVANRKLFDETLYTPLEEAWEELRRRRQDKILEEKVLTLLDNDVPEPLRTEPKAVLFRNVVTPNYEIRRFVSLVNGFSKLEPVFFEYLFDKFTSNNELKRTLGKLYFAHSRGKKGGMNLDSLNIIDFVESDGELITSLTTTWKQDFVEFHHEFFKERYRDMAGAFFDASMWLKSKGKNAAVYYKPFLALFVRHGILFENMMLDEKEIYFAEKIFLPAFLSVHNELGVKPLIVALEPTEIEGDHFWMCYPSVDKEYVSNKMNSSL